MASATPNVVCFTSGEHTDETIPLPEDVNMFDYVVDFTMESATYPGKSREEVANIIDDIADDGFSLAPLFSLFWAAFASRNNAIMCVDYTSGENFGNITFYKRA